MPAPPASGARMRWAELPDEVRAWVEVKLGARIVATIDEPGGFSPGVACRVRCADGRGAFVKAGGTALNPRTPVLHRRESQIMAALPPSPFVPHLVDTFDDGAWVALLYSEIAGATPNLPWQPDELRWVLAAIERLHEALTPCPLANVETAAEALADDLSGWRTLASLAHLPSSIDEWSARHVERFAELEAGWAAASEGDTLLHTDLRADNMLVTGDSEHRVVFVDWAHACRGVAWLDLACSAPSIAMQGGPDPESLMARLGSTAPPEADQLTAVVAALAGYFTYTVTLPAPPGLPTIRAFQAAQGIEARAWLRQRTGWR